MFQWSKRGAIVAVSLLLAACTTAPKFEKGNLSAKAEPVDNLYVYCFLDVMKDQYGVKVLELVRAGLARELSAAHVRHEQRWSKDPQLAPNAALVTTRSYDYFKGASESTMVPVGPMVASNRIREQEFGAAYRLIVFPSSTRATGLGWELSTRWVLMDATLDQVVWDTNSSMETFNFASVNENAEERAQTFVSGLIQEWKRVGFIK